MKCYNCGFENDDNTSYCHECGVNLRKDDMKTFRENVDVLNKEFEVDKRRQNLPPKESIKAKLLYKEDKYSGRLRLAKTKCASIIVFSSFFFFSLIISSFTGNIFMALFIAIAFGLLFAIPVAIIGTVIGYVIDKITH